MNRTLLVGGLAALTLAAAGGAAFAQQAPDRPARAMRADSDGDGRLSRGEFVGRRLERLTAVDSDRDGSVTVDERRAAVRTRMAARADSRFDRLDADDDGAISRAEFDARREMRAERGPRPMRAHRGPHRGHGPARMVRMGAGGAIAIAEVQTRAEQAFSRLDSDGDGFVVAAERQAVREVMRERRRERMAERRAVRQASPRTPASE